MLNQLDTLKERNYLMFFLIYQIFVLFYLLLIFIY